MKSPGVVSGTDLYLELIRPHDTVQEVISCMSIEKRGREIWGVAQIWFLVNE